MRIQNGTAARSIWIATLLFTLALIILCASKLAHGQQPKGDGFGPYEYANNHPALNDEGVEVKPHPAYLYRNAATGESISMDGWRQEAGFLFLEKNGHDCARVHEGDTLIAGHRVFYVSTYKHFGAAHDTSVLPFADPGAAVHFAINECR